MLADMATHPPQIALRLKANERITCPRSDCHDVQVHCTEDSGVESTAFGLLLPSSPTYVRITLRQPGEHQSDVGSFLLQSPEN